jgi:hypothetical protein
MMIAATDSQTRKIRRCQNGSIDMSFYLPRGRRLRAVACMRLLKSCVLGVTGIFKAVSRTVPAPPESWRAPAETVKAPPVRHGSFR